MNEHVNSHMAWIINSFAGVEKQGETVMTNKHTAGPWTVNNGAFKYKDDIWIKGPGKHNFIGKVYTHDHGRENGESNASLIAAAPELLDTCKSIVSALMERKGTDNENKLSLSDRMRLKKSIAKAEGK